MRLIPDGTFIMGNTSKENGFFADAERPVQTMSVPRFYMDETTVTNRMFQEFISATNYMTTAERYGDSSVFYLLIPESARKNYSPVNQMFWWLSVPGACWNHPEGPTSDLQNRLDHPVVHVSYDDARAYCQWAEKRLPTEVQWEYVARNGQDTLYPWGDNLLNGQRHHCNIWQGNFPYENLKDDGFLGTAPAASFHKNQYGVQQMIGNVWEWCENPSKTPLADLAVGPNTLGPVKDEFAIRGGSFLCHQSYCKRYRVFSRNGADRENTASNLGFRCVKDFV
ncbi:SUMF1/EgtB/PvdO family nonheme iron enzyme [Erwinia sp. CPCC 100877]|nr:SUMF1/EgtB/PvdO family nonheme iron enzyme [Erwinia sp. CPCC 100877]